MVDQEKLMERMGDYSLLMLLVDRLRARLPEYLADLSSAIDEADATRLKSEAHKLKGAIANFESPTTNAAALELESMGEQGDLSRAGEVLSGLERNLGQLLIHLEELCRAQAAESEG